MTTQDLTIRVTGPTSGLLHRAAALVRGLVRRRKFKRLQDLDDHILDDIGVTRHEVEIATRLPFTHDAATELRRMSNERRRTNASLMRPLDRKSANSLYQRPRHWL
jgi:uncharacterized protein YjiS (DUF1127 family)